MDDSTITISTETFRHLCKGCDVLVELFGAVDLGDRPFGIEESQEFRAASAWIEANEAMEAVA